MRKRRPLEHSFKHWLADEVGRRLRSLERYISPLAVENGHGHGVYDRGALTLTNRAFCLTFLLIVARRRYLVSTVHALWQESVTPTSR